MVRFVTAAVALASALACGSGAADKDPVKDTLYAAKVAYDKEMREYRALAVDWFDKREEDARKAGNKKTVDQIKIERKAFDEGAELPKAAPTTIQQKPALARKALEAAYAQAVKDFTRAKQDGDAEATEKEYEAFKRSAGVAGPKVNADALHVGTLWAGTMLREGPMKDGKSFDAPLVVITERRGPTFKGYVGNKKFDGTIVDGKVSFATTSKYDSGKGIVTTETSYKGTLKGEELSLQEIVTNSQGARYEYSIKLRLEARMGVRE